MPKSLVQVPIDTTGFAAASTGVAASVSSAIVVDGNSASRATLVTQLHELGYAKVQAFVRPQEARKAMEESRPDLVLCEQSFHDTPCTGQDLLDDLRRVNSLAYSTIFVMITAQTTKAQVTEAAESSLDIYLLKPHTTAELESRIKLASRRKEVLKDVFEAIEAGHIERAARRSLQRFAAQGEFALYAGRVGAELLLAAGRLDKAESVYSTLIASCDAPWVQLGLVRCRMEQGQTSQALTMVQALLQAHPDCAEGHELRGRLLFEQGDLKRAYQAYQSASELTPGSVTRLQRLGMLAYYLNQPPECKQALDKATRLNISSKLFDPQTLVVRALLSYREGDTRSLRECLAQTRQISRSRGATEAIDRMAHVVRTLLAANGGDVEDSRSSVAAMAEELLAQSFDIQVACLFTSMLCELAAKDITFDQAEIWLTRLGLRFCTSQRAVNQLLGAASAFFSYGEHLLAAHTRVQTLASENLMQVLQGDAALAITAMVTAGEESLNARLLENAWVTLQRHRAKVPGVEALEARINAVRSYFDDGSPRAGTRTTAGAPPQPAQGPRATVPGGTVAA